MIHTKHIESRSSIHFTFRYYTCRFLANTLLFASTPAFFFLYSCSPIHTGDSIVTAQNSGSKAPTSATTTENLHVFTYNRDSLKRLDSYQKFGKNDGNKVDVCSRSGAKTIVLCGNSHYDEFRWHDIQSLENLGDLTFNIENENPAFPLSAEIIYTDKDGWRPQTFPQLQPFLAEIRLNDIRVDFSGKSYSGKPMTDIKVYLTNISSEITLTQKDFGQPKRITNHGSLNQEEILLFHNPSMVYQETDDIEDGECKATDLRLYCYPNTSKEESAGSPFTRLVIEGKINGHTYYYPINVNRPQEYGYGTGTGVERNRRYSYSIEIRKTGMDSPDIPADSGQISTSITVEPWTEKEEYDIAF